MMTRQRPAVFWSLPDPALELPSPLPVDGGGQAPYPSASADVLTASWDGRLALAVSRLASPPVLGAAALLSVAAPCGRARRRRRRDFRLHRDDASPVGPGMPILK